MIHDQLEYCLLSDVCTTRAPDAVRQSSGNGGWCWRARGAAWLCPVTGQMLLTTAQQ